MTVKVRAIWLTRKSTVETIAYLPAPSDTINFMSAEDSAHVFRYDPDAVDTRPASRSSRKNRRARSKVRYVVRYRASNSQPLP